MTCKIIDENFLDSLLQHMYDEEHPEQAQQQDSDSDLQKSEKDDAQETYDKKTDKRKEKTTKDKKRGKFDISMIPPGLEISIGSGTSLKKDVDNSSKITLDSILNSEEDKYNDSLIGDVKKDAQFRILGRKTTIIDKFNFAGLSNTLENINIENPLTADPIRYYSGRCYNLDQNLRLNTDLAYVRTFKPLLKSMFLLESYSDTVNPSDFGRTIETYKFKIDTEILSDQRNNITENLFNSFINGGSYNGTIKNQNKTTFNFNGLYRPNSIIREATFQVNKPFKQNEYLEKSVVMGSPIVKINFDYNFYIKEYENIASSKNTAFSVKENLLPNLYIFKILTDSENIKDRQPPKINNFLKNYVYLDNYLSKNLNPISSKIEPNRFNRTPKTTFNLKNSVGEYFDLFSLNFKNFNDSSKMKDEMLERSKNIFLKSSITNKINSFTEKKYMFPMNTVISIPTDPVTNVTRVLKQTGLLDNFIIKFIQRNIKDNKNLVNFYSSTEYTDTRKSSNGKNIGIDKKYSFENLSADSYDIVPILNDLKNNVKEISNFISLSDVEETEQSPFVRNLNNVIFQGKLQSIIKQNFRNYKDILSGLQSYNETIFYRIQKTNEKTGEVLQNYWIANDPDVENLDLIDTQLKYGEKYKYEIFAYQFVIGTNYWIDSVEKFANSNEEISVKVVQEPKIFLTEIPLVEDVVKVHDDFPLPPETIFVPFYNTDNSIGILLNNSYGSHFDTPIKILADDDNILKDAKINIDGKIKYKADDIPKRFEIFRTDKKPKSYEDFSKSSKFEVSTLLDEIKQIRVSGLMYKDYIMPNKKYYYTFRTIDIHDNFSNPSTMYEVEIVNEKGVIFPIIKEFNFETPISVDSIDAKRFIYINLNPSHKLIDQKSPNYEIAKTAELANRNLRLGSSQEFNPWNKDFKMILTSKQTNRKMEIRFKFTHKPEQNK